jgi:2-oxo-4-hydroxy-4-carboxy-5-ureidoimidazoline decarboxylase
VGWLDRFNTLGTADAERELDACCACPAWTAAVARGRPYRDGQQLLDAADAAFATLSWSQLAPALAAHPRIGERATGSSAQEQSGVRDESRAALLVANRVYEERFGHVFLICATGRSGEQMLEALHRRLRNDEEAERAVVRDELRKITRLRLEKLVGT